MSLPTIPNFSIAHELGRGGMAVVYLAQQVPVERRVALKVIAAEYAVDKDFRDAFLQESERMTQLEHPNIVSVYEAGSAAKNSLYIAMEYLAGGNLQARLQQHSLPLDSVLHILKQLGKGLQYAHEQGFLHGDIKPENVLFNDEGVVKLADFGIAKLQESGKNIANRSYITSTAHYISPEQAMNKPLDHRADIYSLALVVFEMLTGDKVCKADSLVGAIHQHSSLPAPDLPAKYQPIQAVLQRALAKQPEARYESVKEFVASFTLAVAQFQHRQVVQPVADDTVVFQEADETVVQQPPAQEPATSSAVVAEEIPQVTNLVSDTSHNEPKQTEKSFWLQPLVIVSLLATFIVAFVFWSFLLEHYDPIDELFPSTKPAMTSSTSMLNASPTLNTQTIITLSTESVALVPT